MPGPEAGEPAGLPGAAADVKEEPVFEVSIHRFTVDLERARSGAVEATVIARMLQALRALVTEFEERSRLFTRS